MPNGGFLRFFMRYGISCVGRLKTAKAPTFWTRTTIARPHQALAGNHPNSIEHYEFSLSRPPPPSQSHEMPCFFSPRDTPLKSPILAPIYSSHLFQIREQ
ncbi:hypothetical protein JG688_00009507 [Phytophthora aleatoria]|uniref:Uncharacterized protein n=1 Tax=Phytophthora aleatoria TaxID=2496075 RepID=A0A8J5IGA1_9STRA|nr:hypothetical protein JG688_00009507 [Phytophthora aleatoria]